MQRFGFKLKGYVEAGEARVAIIDKILIKVGGSYYWLWLAIEPERRKILLIALNQARNALIARSLLKELKRRYGRARIVSDAGKRYLWKLKPLSWSTEVISGEIRSSSASILESY